MSRIRTIKPEFFKHEELFDAERETSLPLRLAFAGLWTCCDREGRFEWRARALKADILPYDDLDFSLVMDALEGFGFIKRYNASGKTYGYVPSWPRHQSINQREAASRIPAPEDAEEGAHMHAYARPAREYEYKGINIASALRETIFARDSRKCKRCGSGDDLTVDHIFPRSIGGTHAPSNLRTLCRSCNSSRPVAGQPLLDDLASDGLALSDMQRICMHVHAHGERKGKEGEEYSDTDVSDGAAVEDDFAKQVFDRAVAFLGRHGTPDRQARSFVGRLRKTSKDADIFDAFAACGKAGAVDPIPWITARLSKPKTDLDAAFATAMQNLSERPQ